MSQKIIKKSHLQIGILFFASFVIFFHSFTLHAAHAATILEYERNLASASPVIRPSAVTVDPGISGLCVTDAASRALDVFDEHGFHRYRTDATSEISSPRDGSIDPHGGFVFIDAIEGNGRTIKRLNFLGEPEAYDPEIPSSDWSPRHLIITSEGHYVTVDRSGLLAKHNDRTGALIWKLQLVDAEWEGSDLLGRPAESADGRIYVPNSRLGQIQVVSRDGETLTAFGIPGTKRGELSFPVGVAFEPEGRILVLDRMRHVVLVFDSNHRFLSEYGRVGFAPGDFYHPVAIAASPDGLVYVAQGFEGRIQVFRLLDTASKDGALSPSEPAVKRGSVSE